jgi:cytochrome c biogenesis protein CcdA
MSTRTTATTGLISNVGAGVVFLAMVVGGVGALVFFWNQILQPGEFSSMSLPVVALVAGVAATFNPCGLPALPGFLTFLGGSGEETPVGRRLGLSISTSLGAMSLVMVLGVVVALAGAGTKGLIGPYVRWVQLAVGLFLIGLATLHLLGRTANAPLVGPIMRLGGRVWEGAMDRPTPRGSFLFGGGFVLVGVG